MVNFYCPIMWRVKPFNNSYRLDLIYHCNVQVLAALQRMDDKEAQQLRTSSTLFELLSLEKLIFNGE